MSFKTCYTWTNYESHQTVLPDENQIPCVLAGYEAKYCCRKGDTCLYDFICQFTPSYDTESGFYLGGCVNDHFDGAACPEGCTRFNNQDIAYNSTLKEWSCCALEPSGSINCSSPSNHSFFSAPSPENLTASLIPSPSASASLGSISFLTTSSMVSDTNTPQTSSSPTSTSAAVTDTLNTSQPSPVASFQRASGLTVGSRAGIGIACVVGGLAALAAIYVFIRRSRKKTLVTHAPVPKVEYTDQAFTGGKPELDARERMLLDINELDATEQTQAGTGVRSELDAGMMNELDTTEHIQVGVGMRSGPGVEELIGKRVVSPIEAPGDGAEMSSELDVGNLSGERPANDFKAAVVDTGMRGKQDGGEESEKKMRKT